MATEEVVKPVVQNGHEGCDSDDEDDMPLVFKRSSNNTSSSTLNRPKPSNNSQKTSAIASTKSPPPIKSPLTSPNRTASSSRSPVMKPPVPSFSSKSPLSDAKSVVAKESNGLEKAPLGTNIDDGDDSDDDKPLSARVKVPSSSVRVSSQPTVKKSNMMPQGSNNGTKKNSSTVMSSTVQTKTSVASSSSKPVPSEQKRPLANNITKNGLKPKAEEHSPLAPSKRPLEKGSSSNHTSVKWTKLSETVKTEQGSQSTAMPDVKGKNMDVSKPSRANKTVVKEVNSDDDDDDHVPISSRMKTVSSNSKSSSVKQNSLKVASTSRTIAKKPNKGVKDSKYTKTTRSLSSGDGQKKWTTLEHCGVIFPPPYKCHGVKILYKGKPVELTPEQEEIATMFAVMKETDYYTKRLFRENFWDDWRKVLGTKHVIQKLDDCDFTPIYEWHLREKEKKQQMTSEEKKALKEEKMKKEEKYMWAVVDGAREKVGNFRVEPPGLFRGRGEHPKMGKYKRRIHPSDITINIGKGLPVPECPIPGERWKEVKHDNTVTWLAFWNDPINSKECKYVFLAASSALKGQSDKDKYEKARNLKIHIDSIRATYTKNFTSSDVKKRQIAVATYLIDKLALRAGNEKDKEEEAETVGCCTLKVGNVECIPPNKIKFDFLGKDSIQYVNTVEVEAPVYKAIGQFKAGKSKGKDLFDEIDTNTLNTHLKELVPGLTAKVFRTYNASITLDNMLSQETRDGEVNQKLAVYQQANKEVAIICNHQRAVSKSHGAQIEKLCGKIKELEEGLTELQNNLALAKKGKPPSGSDGKKPRELDTEAWEKKIDQQNDKINKMKRDMDSKEDLKTVALGTSKINYLDPRITVAWCKRHEVPIEKIFTKTLLAKFAWAMDAEPDFRF